MTLADLKTEMLARQILAAKDELAQRDPNALIEHAGGLVQRDLHRRIQAHLLAHDEAYIEFPRGHGKTVQCAWAVARKIGQNPSIRIKWVAQTDPEASKSVGLVQGIIESEAYRRIFPHVVPDRSLWGKMAFKVKGAATQRDATLEASSIFGHAGGRYDLLIGDDVCDLRNAIQVPALREQVKDAWRNTWLPMADPSAKTKPQCWCFGTPWHRADITATWRAEHEAKGSLLRLPCRGFDSPWPEAFTPAVLQEKKAKMGERAYARAYLLTPVADEDLRVKPEWFKFWTDESEIPPNGRRVVGVDPAISEKDSADYSAIVEAVYLAPKLYVTNLTRGRWAGPDLKRAICSRFEAFQPHEGAVESVQFQALLVSDLLERAPYPIHAVVPGGDPIGKDKSTRIDWLAIHIQNGNIVFRGTSGLGTVHPSQAALFDELTGFPVAEHDDTMDALFYAARAAMKVGRVRVGW